MYQRKGLLTGALFHIECPRGQTAKSWQEHDHHASGSPRPRRPAAATDPRRYIPCINEKGSHREPFFISNAREAKRQSHGRNMTITPVDHRGQAGQRQLLIHGDTSHVSTKRAPTGSPFLLRWPEHQGLWLNFCQIQVAFYPSRGENAPRLVNQPCLCYPCNASPSDESSQYPHNLPLIYSP